MHIGGGPVGFFVGLVITPASTYVHTRTPAGSVSLASIGLFQVRYVPYFEKLQDEEV
jgi:hypothetical protein